MDSIATVDHQNREPPDHLCGSGLRQCCGHKPPDHFCGSGHASDVASGHNQEPPKQGQDIPRHRLRGTLEIAPSICDADYDAGPCRKTALRPGNTARLRLAAPSLRLPLPLLFGAKTSARSSAFACLSCDQLPRRGLLLMVITRTPGVSLYCGSYGRPLRWQQSPGQPQPACRGAAQPKQLRLKPDTRRQVVHRRGTRASD